MLSNYNFGIIRKHSVLAHSEYFTFTEIKNHILLVVDVVNGKGKNNKRRLLVPDDEQIEKVQITASGYIEDRQVFRHKGSRDKTRVARISLAWWTNECGIKYFRVTGDRIFAAYYFAETPPMNPFGLSEFHIVFPTKESSVQCLQCKCYITDRNHATWHEAPEEIDPKKMSLPENYFLCRRCEYEWETGFGLIRGLQGGRLK